MKRLALPGILLTLLLSASTGQADPPRLYMAWHAPYGTPGATDNVMSHCGDGGRDTLFLTFETGRDTTRLDGLESILYLRAPAGQPLSRRWEDERFIEVYFPSDSIPGVTRMWQGALSMNFAFYDKTSGSGRLRLSQTRPRPVALRDHTPYLYARVLISHPPGDTEGCDQPICIEWATGQMVVDTTASSILSGHAGHEYVTINSPNGAVCESYDFRTSPEEPKAAPPRRNKKKGTKR